MGWCRIIVMLANGDGVGENDGDKDCGDGDAMVMIIAIATGVVMVMVMQMATRGWGVGISLFLGIGVLRSSSTADKNGLCSPLRPSGVSPGLVLASSVESMSTCSACAVVVP